jgi:DNA polymerase III subunit epsilon
MQELFFDIESTGPNANKDRIVELAIIVRDQNKEILLRKVKRYNPGIPISKEASEIHGIKDSDVADCPSFEEDAKKLKKIFENKIIITYNGLKFDIPLLMAEFNRAGVEVNLSGKFMDALKIERKLHPQTLSQVYKNYTGRKLDGAHGALSDVEATMTVLDAQYEVLYTNLAQADGLGADVPPETKWPDMIASDLYEMSGAKNSVDYGGKLARDAEGYLIFTFGTKCKGKRVIENVDYVNWILGADFGEDVKKALKEEINKHTIKKLPVSKPIIAVYRSIKPQKEMTFGPVDENTPF